MPTSGNFLRPIPRAGRLSSMEPPNRRTTVWPAHSPLARRRQDGVPLPAGYAASLNGLFAGDQDEAWASLQQAAADRMRAASEHERWQREETARRRAAGGGGGTEGARGKAAPG